MTNGNHHIIWKESVGSTNDELKYMAENGAPHGTVLVADRQTKGRGRMGRTWDSPPGDNIYMSILLRPDMDITKVSMITLVAALAVMDAMKEALSEFHASHESLSMQIKWPNDIVLAGRKVCGILTEMRADSHGIQYVIVGIGMNVNREIFPEELAYTATSLTLPWMPQSLDGQSKKGKKFLVEGVLRCLEEKYQVFLQQGNLVPFLEEYNERLAGLGRQVQILSREGRRTGISHGIDESGALMVSDKDGKIEKIISGEVSVRGLYGYVDEEPIL